jgi:hypothetical protein
MAAICISSLPADRLDGGDGDFTMVLEYNGNEAGEPADTGTRRDPVGVCYRLAAHPAAGDPEHLGCIGVPVVHELRGVGKNMQDHYVARVSYPVVGAQTANERSRGLPLAGEVMRWLFTGKGMLTYSPSIVAASVKVLEESATPDVQVTFAPGSFKNGQIG